MHPVPERLPVHAAGLRRGLPVDALQHQSQRQHPPRRLRVPAPRRRRPQLRRRQIRPCDRDRHHLLHLLPLEAESQRSTDLGIPFGSQVKGPLV
jgi:hypothetical protein